MLKWRNKGDPGTSEVYTKSIAKIQEMDVASEKAKIVENVFFTKGKEPCTQNKVGVDTAPSDAFFSQWSHDHQQISLANQWWQLTSIKDDFEEMKTSVPLTNPPMEYAQLGQPSAKTIILLNIRFGCNELITELLLIKSSNFLLILIVFKVVTF